jgi:hypothetical protein
MCYSPEVSFGTWGAGLLAALYLYSKGKDFLFPLVVSQMQLIEGLRWIHAIDERVLAVFGKLALYSQPVAAFVEAKQYAYIYPYILVQSITELFFGSRDLRFVTAADGHFEWKWSVNPISFAALPYWIGLLKGALFLLSREVGLFMLAFFVYYFITHAKYNTVGSLWCVSVNLLWIYYLFLKK